MLLLVVFLCLQHHIWEFVSICDTISTRYVTHLPTLNFALLRLHDWDLLLLVVYCLAWKKSVSELHGLRTEFDADMCLFPKSAESMLISLKRRLRWRLVLFASIKEKSGESIWEGLDIDGDLPFMAEVMSRVDCGGVEGISSITILMAGISLARWIIKFWEWPKSEEIARTLLLLLHCARLPPVS